MRTRGWQPCPQPCSFCTPALALWAVLTAHQGWPWLGGVEVPADEDRVMRGLQHLPAPQDVGEGSLELGPWCAGAPLWGN